jgi:hypothetical protein
VTADPSADRWRGRTRLTLVRIAAAAELDWRWCGSLARQNFFLVPDDFKEAAELQEEEEKAANAANTADSDGSDDDADLHV